jgi:hypothetical protein
MNKGSITQFVKGNTAHRFPKVVALAISSCMLVGMIAIDASASPNRPSIAIAPTHLSGIVARSSFAQLFGFGHRHLTPITPASPVKAPITATPSGSSSGGGGTSTTTAPPITSSAPSPSQTTTTTTAPVTTTTSSTTSSSGGLITAGPSRSECLEPNFVDSGLASLQAAVSSFQSETHSTVSCVLAYLNTSPNWASWEDPWITGPSGSAYTSWVGEAPQSRQLVLQVDLIPVSLENTSNPLSWEQSCAAGNFNSYATELGNNLVSAGLQNSVLRLGAEMNGPWEVDFVGTTTQEQNLWASCFDNEVSALRQAAGQHFLFDWNPNACTEAIPYANYYPGNSYVDILGLDFYDIGCNAPTTPLAFAQLSGEASGLTGFEAFAAAQNKPMSFPEWGLESAPAGDDPAYVNGLGSTVNNGDFAFQSYFDYVDGNTMLLDSSTPLSLAAYQKWFGNN